MKTKVCDICGKSMPIGYVFWSEITTPDPHDYEQREVIDVCAHCFRDYIFPAFDRARLKEQIRKEEQNAEEDRKRKGC